MDKVQALLPLLGWFYITVGLFVVFCWITRDRFPELKRLYYGAFGAIAFVFIMQSLVSEVQMFSLSKKTSGLTYKQKMVEESSAYFENYYEKLRPMLTKKDVVYLPNADTREYHYARAFLYPAEVLVKPVPEGESLAILNTGDLKKFPRLFEVLQTSGDRSLIRVEGVRR